MGHVRHIQRVEAPIEDVWALSMRVDRLPEWNPYQDVEHLTGPLDQVGTAFDSTLRLLGQRLAAHCTVTQVDPGRLLRITSSSPEGASEWTYRYEQAGGGTLCALDIEYDLGHGPVAAVLDRLLFQHALERAVRHMAENFAAIAEARVRQPA